jgi:hypothetical protein
MSSIVVLMKGVLNLVSLTVVQMGPVVYAMVFGKIFHVYNFLGSNIKQYPLLLIFLLD